MPAFVTRSGVARLAALLALTLVAGLSPGVVGRLPEGSLLPWIAFVAAAAVLPVLLGRSLDLFEPATFAVWTHFAPTFVVGSLFLALHVVDYPFPGLVRDPQRAMALALLLTATGLAALALGASSGTASAIGLVIGRRLPRLEAEGREIGPFGIAVAAAVGTAGSLVAFRQGIIGYQVPGASSWTGVAGYYLSWCLPLAHFLFWFRLFRSARRAPAWVYLFPLLLVVYTVVLWGNRGAVLSCYLVAAFAFRLARGPLSLRGSVVAVFLSFVSIGAGMAFGSALRVAKGGETPAAPVLASPAPAGTPSMAAAPGAPADPRVPGAPRIPDATGSPPSTPAPTGNAEPRPGSLNRQLHASGRAVASLTSSPVGATASTLLQRVAQRLEILSHASVTVARAEALQPLEKEAGVSSVGEALLSGFVPRALWPDKPRAGDARAYAKLYFGWDGNSFAVTFAVDAFRSWGPWAVVPALALLGGLLGLLSAALVEGGTPVDAGRAALWALLLLAVPWEGFYGLVVPVLLRVGAVVVFGLLVVGLAERLSARRTPR